MARFNSKSAGIKTINKAGGQAYKTSPELELVSLMATSFANEKYYSTAEEQIERLCSLFSEVDNEFFAKTMLFARNQLHMRSMTHMGAALVAMHVKGKTWTSKFFSKVVERPDDMTEIMSIILATDGPVPNSLKKGFSKAFEKFDEYQLAKYKGEKRKLSLVDVVNLVHPVPNDKNREALRKLVNDELKSKDTWESEISSAGKSLDPKAATNRAWKELLYAGKIGYFALLRNINNIIEACPECEDKLIEQLIDRYRIKKSKVLPFRYITALQNLKGNARSRNITSAVSKAIDISLDNCPEFPGKTLVALDCSGSMHGRPWDIGSLFAAVIFKRMNADIMTFSSDAEYQILDPEGSVLGIAQSMYYAAGGTNFHSIFEVAARAYDRIIILSDMQGWMGYSPPTKPFEDYKSKFECNPDIFSFDLAGYGPLQFPENGIYCIAGFSDKVFSIMKLLSEDKKALVNSINRVELT